MIVRKVNRKVAREHSFGECMIEKRKKENQNIIKDLGALLIFFFHILCSEILFSISTWPWVKYVYNMKNLKKYI